MGKSRQERLIPAGKFWQASRAPWLWRAPQRVPWRAPPNFAVNKRSDLRVPFVEFRIDARGWKEVSRLGALHSCRAGDTVLGGPRHTRMLSPGDPLMTKGDQPEIARRDNPNQFRAFDVE